LYQKHSDLFCSIADNIKGRNARNKQISRQCATVFDEIIRPAIRLAAKDIAVEGEFIEFYPEEKRPHIRVGTNEIKFTCRGTAVEIKVVISNVATIDEAEIRDISEDLIADKIARFFRRVYDLA